MSVLTVQFVTDRRILIPGTGNVAVRGQLLEIGPGKPGTEFPYRSPKEQIDHYGEQLFVLLSVKDEEGFEEDHLDVDVNLGKGPATIDAEDVSTAPEGVHEVMKNRGAVEGDPSFQQNVESVEEVDKPTPKRRVRKTSVRNTRAKKKNKKE